MKITGYAIGEKKNGQLAKIYLNRELTDREFRELSEAPPTVKIRKIQNLKVLKANITAEHGRSLREIDYFGEINSCEVDELFHLLH